MIRRLPLRRVAPRGRVHYRVRLLTVVSALVAATGCGASPAERVSGTLTVHLHDFGIDISRTQFRSGLIAIDLTNLGPTTHEFNLDETSLNAADLPLSEGLPIEAYLFQRTLRTDGAQRNMKRFLEIGGQTRAGELRVGALNGELGKRG